ncbi:hypothetical protein B0T21DRAFT_32293 [Apiosordaria backusii]|uniref:Uncharacterized protein n=1 Tax=Apiosordaria backusii TaxID=314023 RepID=A0AA40B2C0_9PEZI|nr:hypothetical protein B0T21DRAFT_32293 [Apiosordaria backusii]
MQRRPSSQAEWGRHVLGRWRTAGLHPPSPSFRLATTSHTAVTVGPPRSMMPLFLHQEEVDGSKAPWSQGKPQASGPMFGAGAHKSPAMVCISR